MSSPKTSKKICVIQLAKMGDFIQSAPLLATLRETRPGAKIVLAAAQPDASEMAGLSGLPDEIVLVGADGEIPAPLAGENFTELFNLNTHERAAAALGKISAAAKFGPRLEAGRLILTPAQKFLSAVIAENRRLAAFNLVDLWRGLAGDFPPKVFSWPRPAEASSLPSGARAIRVGFQPGCQNHLRRWPAEHFADMIARMFASGLEFSPVLLGTREEKVLGARLEKNLPPHIKTLNLMGRTSLKDLTQIIAGLDLLVAADTGAAHLAAALNVPVLGLFFGPAYGPETAPYGPGHVIYQALADCAPCREGAGCREKSCRVMPLPDVAARLALARLAGDFSAREEMPIGHKAWRSGLDEFGQYLRPLFSPPLDVESLTALFIREAGRSYMSPSYALNPERARAELAAFDPPAHGLDYQAVYEKAKILSKKTLSGQTKASKNLEAVFKLFISFR